MALAFNSKLEFFIHAYIIHFDPFILFLSSTFSFSIFILQQMLTSGISKVHVPRIKWRAKSNHRFSCSRYYNCHCIHSFFNQKYLLVISYLTYFIFILLSSIFCFSYLRSRVLIFIIIIIFDILYRNNDDFTGYRGRSYGCRYCCRLPRYWNGKYWPYVLPSSLPIFIINSVFSQLCYVLHIVVIL